MNRDQKAAAIAEIGSHIDESEAIFAVDYRGISVEQIAELRTKLRDADATFKVVKNSLTERAADQADVQALKDFLAGPTALTFVRGDAAVAAKAIADYARATQMLPFKGGLMDGSALDSDQLRSLSRLPSREVLYGQLVGVVASPVSGLVRSLAALLGGLAAALGQVREKKESGEIPAGAQPAVAEDAAQSVEAPETASETAEPAEGAQEPASEAGEAVDAAAETAEEPATEAAQAAEPAEEPAATAADTAETAETAEEPDAEAAETTEAPQQEAEQEAAEEQPEDAENNPKED